MRRVIRRRIRHSENGINLAVDFNADIVINDGRDEVEEPQPEPAPPDDNDQEGNES